jgi:hypothetical protein
MNPLILRMIAYFALPVLGALAAWLATAVPGVSWDAVTQTVTIRLEALVGGLAGGVGIAATVFALWGNKSR